MGAEVFCEAVPDRRGSATYPAPHYSQNNWTGGSTSAGVTTEPDGGLSALATGAEEDRRTLGAGEMLARLLALSAVGAAPGPRRRLSDGMAAQL